MNASPSFEDDAWTWGLWVVFGAFAIWFYMLNVWSLVGRSVYEPQQDAGDAEPAPQANQQTERTLPRYWRLLRFVPPLALLGAWLRGHRFRPIASFISLVVYLAVRLR